MFQFPGFASSTYVFSERYPKGVGCPIRISTDQSLLAAPHGFSQRATSFIASWCQGIHRMPFSRSQQHANRSRDQRHTMHGNQPHTPKGRTPRPMQATRSRSHLHTHLALLNETQTMPGQTDITPRPKSAPEPIQLPTNNDTPKGLSPPDTSISCLPRRRPIPHHPQTPPAHAPGQDPRKWRRSGSNR